MAFRPRVMGVLAVVAVLSACSSSRMAAESPPQNVELDGVSYRVEQITASTWTVGRPATLAAGPQQTALLVRAVEKASSCKVTDSSFVRGGAVMNAQVDCGSRLKN
ncbi:MAG: hypothetical protein Q7T70_03090 [Polaromonas sp.]|nr:hypothetical protein [Polaromonas sp.]